MQIVKLGEKGQITLPKKYRDQYHLEQGTHFRIIDQGQGVISIIPVQHSSRLNAPQFNFLKARSVQEMNDAIEKEAREHYK